MRHVLTVAFLMGLTGCADEGKETGDTSDTGDTDTDTDTDTTPTPTFAVTLEATGVTLAITNGSGDYDFGLAQGGTEDNWTGEDCHNGYTLGSGEVLQYCHTAGPTGITLTLGTLDEVEVDNTKTLFSDTLPGSISWYIAGTDGACYVGGDDSAGNYTDLGCTAL